MAAWGGNIMGKQAASALIAAFSFIGTAAAQIPTPQQLDPKDIAPTAQNPQRNPTPSRNQFFSPIMGINIEGEGLALPKGVAEEMPIKPAAENPPTQEPTPSPK